MSAQDLIDIGGQFSAGYDIRYGLRLDIGSGPTVIDWTPVGGAGRRVEGATMVLTPNGVVDVGDFNGFYAPAFAGGGETLDAVITARPQFNAAQRNRLFLGVVWKSTFAAAGFPVLAGIYNGAFPVQRQYLLVSSHSTHLRPVGSIWEPGPTERGAAVAAGVYSNGLPQCSQLWHSGIAGAMFTNVRQNRTAIQQVTLASVADTATTEVFRIGNTAVPLQAQATIAAVLLSFTSNPLRTATEFVSWAERDWKVSRS